LLAESGEIIFTQFASGDFKPHEILRLVSEGINLPVEPGNFIIGRGAIGFGKAFHEWYFTPEKNPR
jgi:hypothetical protein